MKKETGSDVRMTEKRFTIQSDANAEEIKLLIDKEQMVMWSFLNHDEAVNHICDLLNALHEENQELKHELFCKQFDNLELKPHNCKCKVELNDIVGIVKTDEPTNSVELKKEIYK